MSNPNGFDQAVITEFRVNGDRILIIAAKFGSPSNPDGYHNLVAN